MSFGLREWMCGYCHKKGLVPGEVNDSDVWLAMRHGYGKCVPPPGFTDGGGI